MWWDGSNLTAGGHDVLSVELTKELISRDILVLTAGCSSGGIENCGLMTPEAAKYAGPKLRAVCEKLNIPPVLNFGPCLAIGRLEIVATEIAAELGVDLPQLPLVLSAAQWLEEQALADGCFGLALGLPLHLGLPPFVTGSKTAVKVLTEDMKELTGGQVIINGDAKESADILEQIILENARAYIYRRCRYETNYDRCLKVRWMQKLHHRLYAGAPGKHRELFMIWI